MVVEVNYLAVLIASLLSMVVGSVWYAPGVFGNMWARLAKVDMTQQSGKGELIWILGTSFVLSLVTAYMLAHMSFLSNYFFQNNFLQDALATGFWVWLGFTAVRFMTHDLFEGRSKKLTLLTISNEFVTIMAMALVIGIMKP